MEFRLAYRRYRLPFRAPVRTARGTWLEREGVFVRAERPDGTAGFGEASPLPNSGDETVDEDEALCRSLGDRIDEGVLGRLPAGVGALRGALRSAMGLPKVPCHQSLAVAALLPAGRAVLSRAPSVAEAGFRVFKWKVGVGAADDEMAIFDDLIAALPSGSRFRLDANGAWDPRTAGKWLGRCADRPVEFVEQPVAPDSKGADDRLRGLSADYPVPVALDESIGGDRDLGRWMEAGWAGFFIIKPALLGDAPGMLGRLAGMKARVVFSSSLETAIGARAALGEAFAWPGEAHALGFGVWPLFSNPVFDGPSAVPFLRFEDIGRFDPEALWSAVT
jgi:O-succinylbenzoate synthase